MDKLHQAWMSWALGLAGVSALLWGGALLAAPGLVAGLTGVTPEQAKILAPTGLLVGTLGLGYLLATADPYRHWPVVLMGLVAKLGWFAWTAFGVKWGQLPVQALGMAVANDLIWAIPFALILQNAHREAIRRRRAASPEILRMGLQRKTNYGVTLDELSGLSPVLLVFLRHAGCTFCREALADLAAKRKQIEESGARLVLVHMGSEQQGAKFFERYGLAEVAQISDPRRSLYRAFGLPRGSIGDLFGPKVWIRGFEAAILGRHGVGRLMGDGFQMPGVFLLFHGEVVRSYRHQSAADRPDYIAVATGRGRWQAELQS